MNLREKYDAIRQTEQYEKVMYGLKCGVYSLSTIGLIGGSTALVVSMITHDQELAKIGLYINLRSLLQVVPCQ